MAKAKKIETLEQALEAIETLEKEATESAEIIVDLRAKLTASNKVAETKQNIVKLKNRKFKINCSSFHFNGVEHQSSEIESDSEILAELVEIGAGFLEEVK